MDNNIDINWIFVVLGAAGIWVCLWLRRAGWGKRKGYKKIDREIVRKTSERNFIK